MKGAPRGALRAFLTPVDLTVSEGLFTLVHMVLPMVETQVRAGVTRNLGARPAPRESTVVVHCHPTGLRRSVPAGVVRGEEVNGGERN